MIYMKKILFALLGVLVAFPVSAQEMDIEAVSAISPAIGLPVVILLFVLAATVSIFSFVMWILMLIHAAKHPVENKVLWILLIVLVNPIGWVLYYFMVKRNYVEQPVAAVPVQPAAPSQVPPLQ